MGNDMSETEQDEDPTIIEAIRAWHEAMDLGPGPHEVRIGPHILLLYGSTMQKGMAAAVQAYRPSTPSRESSDELASLAAKYLGMSDGDFAHTLGLHELAFEQGVRREVFTDIKRLAGSVVSQARGDK
jgi:hypothetical protein